MPKIGAGREKYVGRLLRHWMIEMSAYVGRVVYREAECAFAHPPSNVLIPPAELAYHVSNMV
jgi:hypothetical protein